MDKKQQDYIIATGLAMLAFWMISNRQEDYKSKEYEQRELAIDPTIIEKRKDLLDDIKQQPITKSDFTAAYNSDIFKKLLK